MGITINTLLPGVRCSECGLFCDGLRIDWETEPTCYECRKLVDRFADLDAESGFDHHDPERYYEAAEEWRLQLGVKAQLVLDVIR